MESLIKEQYLKFYSYTTLLYDINYIIMLYHEFHFMFKISSNETNFHLTPDCVSVYVRNCFNISFD